MNLLPNLKKTLAYVGRARSGDRDKGVQGMRVGAPDQRVRMVDLETFAQRARQRVRLVLEVDGHFFFSLIIVLCQNSDGIQRPPKGFSPT